jgi:hypothetical protein
MDSRSVLGEAGEVALVWALLVLVCLLIFRPYLAAALRRVRQIELRFARSNVRIDLDPVQEAEENSAGVDLAAADRLHQCETANRDPGERVFQERHQPDEAGASGDDVIGQGGLPIATEQKTTIFTLTSVQRVGGAGASGCGSNPPRPRSGICGTG